MLQEKLLRSTFNSWKWGYLTFDKGVVMGMAIQLLFMLWQASHSTHSSHASHLSPLSLSLTTSQQHLWGLVGLGITKPKQVLSRINRLPYLR